MNKKTPTLVGAGIGLALFLAIALLPAMLYGGYAGVLLAGGIFGTPVEPTLLARALLERDPAVRADLERRLADPAFANDPEARRDFFYARHPSFDRAWRRYPVLRADARP